MNTDNSLPPSLKYNPLPSLANVLKRSADSAGGWVNCVDASVAVGFHMKLAGLDWRTNDELALIMTNLVSLKFLEMEKTPEGEHVCRVNPVFVGLPTQPSTVVEPHVSISASHVEPSMPTHVSR